MNDGPVPDYIPKPGVQRAYQPNPADRLSGFTVAWAAWVAAFAVVEGVALHQDAKRRDRVKRTLSSNLRAVFATDSVTGVPLDVPYGRLRRFTLSTAVNWFEHHIGREGLM